MRASPPFLCRVVRFGVWRGSVGLIASVDLAVMGAWAATRDEPLSMAAWVVLSLAAIVTTAVATSLVRIGPVMLRWDGRQWWRMAPSRHGVLAFDPAAGRPCVIDVTLDLGAWLMLRLRAPPGESSQRTQWLPIQRRGFDASWHGLRCALYAAAAPSGADAADSAEFAR